MYCIALLYNVLYPHAVAQDIEIEINYVGCMQY